MLNIKMQLAITEEEKKKIEGEAKQLPITHDPITDIGRLRYQNDGFTKLTGGFQVETHNLRARFLFEPGICIIFAMAEELIDCRPLADLLPRKAIVTWEELCL